MASEFEMRVKQQHEREQRIKEKLQLRLYEEQRRLRTTMTLE